MSVVTHPNPVAHPAIEAESRTIFQQQRQRLFARTDRMFAVLMLVQWLGGIAAALWVSPRVWHGSESHTHLHVWMAIFLGGAIASLPIYLALRHAGKVYTRHTIAVAQVLFSVLLIDLTGGRIETHFHVFGSLAFLAVYGDWTVLLAPTLVVAADHLLRGIYLPESVYGVLVASPWRSLEHAAWVLFEDTVLVFSCRQSVHELRRVALRTAELGQRTHELEMALQSNQSIVDAALDAVVTMDGKGRIVGWNPQAENLFDLPRDQALGRDLADTIIPPELRDNYRLGLERYRHTNDSPVLNRRIEVEAQTEARGRFSVELSVVPIHSGRELRFSAFIRDITERCRAEQAMVAAKEAAIAADRAKSQFLANMSHEIRTPLNGILGFAKLLLNDGGQVCDEERHDYLNVIHSSADNLLTLVNDVLDLSKIEAGHLETVQIACSPGQIITEVASLLRAKALEKGLRLEARCAGGAQTMIRSDPARLRQLIMNLASNAIKFTERGEINITAQFAEVAGRSRFCIEVSDTGIGIPADRLNCIFDPFVQADNSVTRKYGGTGLGLSISRHIARALGGDLAVRSSVGQGTVFTAHIDSGVAQPDANLELMPVEAFIGPKPPTKRRAIKLSGRILLVDDGDTNRKLVGLVLRRCGAEVVDAENGEIGVRRALAESFDLILMDMQMPVMDGYTATRTLRQRGFTLPIVALTAHAMKGDEDACRAAGCSGYLTKPIDVERLAEIVGQILSSNDRASQPQPPQTPRPAAAAPTITDDDAELSSIIAEFRQRLSEKMAAMRAALEAGDFDEIRRLAHWLKGTGGTVGFATLSQQAAILERFAKQQSASDVTAALAQLEATSAQLFPEPLGVN